MNMGSYNYLGFAQTEGLCADAAVEATHKYGCGMCSSRHELGEFSSHLLSKMVVSNN